MQYQENIYKNYYQYQKPNSQTRKIVRPNSALVGTNKNKPPINNQQQGNNYLIDEINKYNENEPNKMTMFDQYYKEQIGNKDYKMNPNYYKDLEKQIFQNDKQESIYNNNDQIKNEIINNIEDNNIEENENNYDRNVIQKTNKEINNPKDYIEANKHLISKIQEANNSNKLKEYYEKKENPYHKEYGKTPKYIQEMRLENEKKKEMEKLRKETAKYPKGTRLLSEEERVSTLEKLIQSRDDINKVIEKLPITIDTQAFRNKKEELFKKLDEIENAIETFSKKKVFVKVE